MNQLLARFSADRLPTSNRWWILLGVGLFVFFLLRQIPATWGAYALTRGTGLALSGITGTLWEGRASLASVRLPQGQEQSLGQLSWDLNPLSLLLLKPCADIATKLDRQSFTGYVCASSNGSLRVSDADLSMPIALVQSMLPIPVNGQLLVHIDELQLRGNVLGKLNGNLSWNGAQVNNGANWMDVGNYAAQLKDDGSNGVLAKVFQLSGPVELDLTVELKAPSGGRVHGQLLMDKAFVDASNAAGLLAMIAQPGEADPNGKSRYQVDMSL
ncbi:type II secretion system protein N [Cellvibrio japonicus]|uniref:type II secretion system protein N n=1 Tax=Cellvibrio japonicus TaxID=155077 RepID=UPI0002E6B980|nr:type II secretion system protein N [Cellvibrio japonicus]